MATDVYNVNPLTGTAGSTTLPTGWTGSGTTGWATKINGDGVGIVMTTGTTGGFADNTHLDLTATGTTSLTDYGVFFRFYWPNPLTDQSLAVYIRSSNDWANLGNPGTWVRTSLDYQGRADIKHRLSSGTQVLDASLGAGGIALIAGNSNYCRFEVIGNTLQAKWWNSNVSEPTGWSMSATMSTSIVTGPGQVKLNLLGASAAGVTAFTRVRDFEVYDLSSSGGTTPPPFTPWDAPLRRVRARRR